MKAERTEHFVALARATLAFERAWPALWPASAVLGLFIAAALFELFAGLPWPLHALILAGAITAIGLLLYFNFKDMALPSWDDGARRLERDSALAHRPISECADVLAAGTGDPWAEELWRAHRRRQFANSGRLKLSWPRSDLARRDPRALRFVVLLLVGAGLIAARSDWDRRIMAALGPGNAASLNLSLDAWIDPPPYTGQAPVYLPPTSGKSFSVPQGSMLNLRVHGAGHLPTASLVDVTFAGGHGEYSAIARLNDNVPVRVRAQGRTLGAWDIRVIADKKPSIAFAAPPAKTEHDALKLSYKARDDYGVTAVHAIIRPHGRHGKPLVIELPLPALSAKTLTETAYRDLTAHPYAGLNVDIALEATDGAGQRALSKSAQFRLPSRIFTNPLARALIEQRQNLAIEDANVRERVLETLDALTIAPDRFYQDQPGVYMAIRAAYWALKNARFDEEVRHVQDLLWQTAIGIERGGLLAAAEQLRLLQQMLSQALAQGAPQEVIDALLQRYREALQRYLQALAENAPKDDKTPLPPGAKVLSQADLDMLLKAIEQMAQSGDRAQAQQMLALLQSLLENLHMTQSGTGGTGGQTPGEKALSEAIQNLGALMGKERSLMDKTFRHQQGAGDPKDGGPQGLSKQQGQLREELNKVLKGVPQQGAPKNLGDADRAMGNAQNKLESKDLDAAAGAEKQALDALRKGADTLAKTLMQQSGQNGQGMEGDEDPLGRQQGGNAKGYSGGVKLPDMSELARARSILQELRRRAAERGRPQEELDYIDRLLKQF